MNGQQVKQYQCPWDTRSDDLYYIHDNHFVSLLAYFGVSGTEQKRANGILAVNRMVSTDEISDGTSNTLMVGERPPSKDKYYGWWFAGCGDPCLLGACDVILGVNEASTAAPPLPPLLVGDSIEPGSHDRFRRGSLVQDPDPGSPVTPNHMYHYWSIHAGGSHFLMADGSVHFLAYNIDNNVLRGLSTYRGGEAVQLP
jgi:prepilin-type processing-associated H-X9-DG protein